MYILRGIIFQLWMIKENIPRASIEATAQREYICWKIHSWDDFIHFSVYIHTLKCGHDSPIHVYDSPCIKMSTLLFYS